MQAAVHAVAVAAAVVDCVAGADAGSRMVVLVPVYARASLPGSGTENQDPAGTEAWIPGRRAPGP